MLLAAIGAALLMGSSSELSARNLRGDLLALLAGLLYTGYLIAVERARGALEPLPLLFLASAFGAVDAAARRRSRSASRSCPTTGPASCCSRSAAR